MADDRELLERARRLTGNRELQAHLRGLIDALGLEEDDEGMLESAVMGAVDAMIFDAARSDAGPKHLRARDERAGFILRNWKTIRPE